VKKIFETDLNFKPSALIFIMNRWIDSTNYLCPSVKPFFFREIEYLCTKQFSMASKRDLKKHLNYLIIDVVEEAYNVQLSNPKKIEESDNFIDSVLEFHDTVITRINEAKNKADFRPIREEIEQKAMDFFQDVQNMY